MPPSDLDDLRFVLSCIRSSRIKFRPDFDKVATEIGARNGNACKWRFQRIQKKCRSSAITNEGPSRRAERHGHYGQTNKGTSNQSPLSSQRLRSFFRDPNVPIDSEDEDRKIKAEQVQNFDQITEQEDDGLQFLEVRAVHDISTMSHAKIKVEQDSKDTLMRVKLKNTSEETLRMDLDIEEYNMSNEKEGDFMLSP